MSDQHARTGPSLGLIATIAAIALAALIVGLVVGPPLAGWLDRRSAAAADETGGDATWYISQMHPWIIQPEPGQCPICGMDLTPIDPERFAGEIAIDPVVVQNMGVRTALAEERVLERSVGTVGVVVLDQGQIHDLTLRVGGWIESLAVDAVWDPVMTGQPLLEIYSPELLAAQQEYRVALRGGADDVVAQASRARLVLLGAPDELLAHLESGGEARRAVAIRAPAGGVVLEKHVNAGTRVQPQTLALRIADLSTVWVEVTVYEDQLSFLEQGQPVRITLPYGDGHQIEGTVDRIYPVVDPRTREATVRVVLPNPEAALRPGMYARVAFVGRTPDPVVVIPRSAVIGTGDRRVAFVSLGRGRFEPRDVVLGHRGDEGTVAVRSGIEAGERVVVSGQFLLDSESRMREALAKFMRGDLASGQDPVATTVAAASLPAAVAPAFAAALERYLALQQQLYQATGEVEALAAADDLRAAVAGLGTAARAADEHLHHKLENLGEVLELAAQPAEPGLPGLRVWFGQLSVPLDALVKQVGAPAALADLSGMRCGMAEGIRDDGVWLQRGGDARNPYFGAASGMRSCASEAWGLPVVGATTDAVDEPATSEDAKPEPIAADPAPVAPDAAVVEAALALHAALYADDLAAAQAAAPSLAATLGEGALARTAASIAEAEDLAAARRAYGAIGVALRGALEGAGAEFGADLRLMRCGMYRDAPDKGVWLQRGDEVRNPFFGREAGMASCASGIWAVTADGLEARE